MGCPLVTSLQKILVQQEPFPSAILSIGRPIWQNAWPLKDWCQDNQNPNRRWKLLGEWPWKSSLVFLCCTWSKVANKRLVSEFYPKHQLPWAREMVQQIKADKSTWWDSLRACVWAPEPTRRWKERANSINLSSGFHMPTMAHVHAPVSYTIIMMMMMMHLKHPSAVLWSSLIKQCLPLRVESNNFQCHRSYMPSASGL